MLKFLQRVWSDIVHGENIDVYLTILLSLLISISSLLNLSFVKSENMPGITLGILALITISTLVGRFKVEDISSKISPSLDSLFVSDFPPTLKEDIEHSNEIWITGASLSDLVSENYSLFERKLKGGHFSIRALVMNPNNHDILMLSEMRAYANPSLQRAKAKLEAFINDMWGLKRVNSNSVYIRIVDFPITHRLIAINPNSSAGKIYISNYPFRTPGGSVPKFVIQAKNQQWFEHYKLENNNLWNAGVDVGDPG